MRFGLGLVLCSLLSTACKTGGDSAVKDAEVKVENATVPAGVGSLESGGTKLKYTEYDVRFTNPVCVAYPYAQPVKANNGTMLTQKPKDVFCTQNDSAASANRPEAPQFKLLSWINDPGVKEIFFAYLSFSNKTVSDAICTAIKERNVKVRFEMDSTSDQSQGQELLKCLPGNGDAALKPEMFIRGHTGGIGYAHNKLFLINPGAETMKLAFSSGNMTSGIVLHHENWHFITLPSATFFAQSHLCLVKGVLEHGQTATDYAAFIKTCREAIPFPEESDIKTFFVPGEGPRATSFLLNAIKSAKQIRLAAHRFGYTKMIAGLRQKLQSDAPGEIQMVFDDDVWWAGHGEQTGDNESWEYDSAIDLQNNGAKIKWMETNHGQHLLHHNKYLVLNQPEGSALPSAVFGGAGNLTGTGFTSNFENFYYVTIPEVVAAYNKQYDHVWNELGTTTDLLPAQNILPPGSN